MKKRIQKLLLIIIFTCSGQLYSQWNIAHYGPNGYWLSPSEIFPPNTNWELHRRATETSEWTALGVLRRANSAAEMSARLMDLVGLGVQFDMPSDEEILSIWRKAEGFEHLDSLRNYIKNYPVLYALGLMYLDVNVPSGAVDYKWQVSGNRDIKGDILLGFRKEFPPIGTSFLPISAKAVQNGVHVEYAVEKSGFMHHLKVFRSYYMRTDFQEIRVNPIFYKKDGKMVVSFNDESASPKVAYSYYLVPMDAAGNRGEKSPEIALYNVPENSIVPSVNSLNAKSEVTEKAIKLTWKLKDQRDVVSIDIFKSLLYDGRYFKIASLPPDDTAYMDYSVEPIVTYYYSVVLNGAYEASPASPRVAGMLQASNQNYLPIQDLELSQKGNTITLKWSRTERDTRGYYVYRGNGYEGPLTQHKEFIISDSAEITFNDTLPQDFYPQIYTYSVADVNTSYAIGPKSQRVFAYGSGANILPVIDSISLLYNGKSALIVWENQIENSIFVSKQIIYRKVENVDGKLGEWVELAEMPVETNSYEDTTILDGNKYSYKVYNVTDDGSKSSGSPEVMLDLPTVAVLPVSEISVFATDEKVELNFMPPLNSEIKEIRIYRAEGGKEAVLYKTLDAKATQFIDNTVTKGLQYYYFVFTADAKGREGRGIEPVGVFVK